MHYHPVFSIFLDTNFYLYLQMILWDEWAGFVILSEIMTIFFITFSSHFLCKTT